MPDDPDAPVTNAADALRTLGRKVEPCGDDFGLWRLDDDVTLTDGALVALAIRLGLVDGPERHQ